MPRVFTMVSKEAPMCTKI